jgi:hypothetical protein
MSTRIVNRNVKKTVTKWEQALIDAEAGLRKAGREVQEWKASIQIIRKRIADRAPWPGDKAA